jgi:hypothetical protein
MFKMNKVQVFCQDSSHLAEFEASNRGYRGDIYVETGSGNIYHLHVYDTTRLQQDFETELEMYGFFSIEPNIVLVQEVLLTNIKATIQGLSKQGFFEKLKSLEKNNLGELNLISF